MSTTHALTSAIVGTGLTAFAGEGLLWMAIGKENRTSLAGESSPPTELSLLAESAIRRTAVNMGRILLCLMPASRTLYR